jgi:multidrug transporter EmrE-like cation transporter
MTSSSSLLLILGSVLLSALAQVAFKYGMSSAKMQLVMQAGVGGLLLDVARNPAIVLGFAAYGASALLWLGALSRADLSFAYPFVALGIVLTVLAGVTVFAEGVSMLRLGGTALICLGVILVAMSQPR